MHFHRKKKAKKIHDETQPYIKKPLNAFMIYKRVHIAATLRELKTTQHSIANKVLGKRVSVIDLYMSEIL